MKVQTPSGFAPLALPGMPDERVAVAVGKTVILRYPPLPLVGVSVWMDGEGLAVE